MSTPDDGVLDVAPGIRDILDHAAELGITSVRVFQKDEFLELSAEELRKSSATLRRVYMRAKSRAINI